MSRSSPLLRVSPKGLYCEGGDFYIDPLYPVERAVVTHAHSDHARAGSKAYLASASGAGLLRERIGSSGSLETLTYGERKQVGEVIVSLHPAGHVLGSAQVRVERGGEVWVVSGDYKLEPDPTCAAFEPVPCHTFITECTFGLPIFDWPGPEEVFSAIHQWWRENQAQGKTSVILAYALGKAQRLLADLDPAVGPIGVHGAVEKMLPHYRAAGVALPPTVKAGEASRKELRSQGIIIAPASATNTAWMRRFSPCAIGSASGWMTIRGNRRRSGVDRGFVLSDHVDWKGILKTVRDTGASRIGLTHGTTNVLHRWLREEEGLEAFVLPSPWNLSGLADRVPISERGEEA